MPPAHLHRLFIKTELENIRVASAIARIPTIVLSGSSTTYPRERWTSWQNQWILRGYWPLSISTADLRGL